MSGSPPPPLRGAVVLRSLASPRRAVTDAPDARRGAPMLVSGAVVHTLPAGATFDLHEVRLTDFVQHHPDPVVRLEMAKPARSTSKPQPTPSARRQEQLR